MSTDKSDDAALHGRIVPTLLSYLGASLVGLLAMTTASIIDGIFIGNIVGVTALAAVNLIIPIINLLYGVAVMLSIGGAVRAGKYLGDGDIAAASAIFSKTLIFVFCLSVVVIGAGFAFEQQLFAAVGATPELYSVMSQYYRVLLPFMAPMLMVLVLYYFVRVDGFPNFAAVALIAGALLNIALDYLMIAVLGWGLFGAALATGIAQSLPFLAMLCYFFFAGRRLQFGFKQRGWKEVFQAAYNGISEFINEISGAIIAFILNWMLITRAGVDGVAAITVVFYVIFLGFMIYYSISESVQVLVSKNFGAGNIHRINEFLKTAAMTVAVCSLCFIATLFAANESMINLFVSDEGSQATVELAIEFVGYLWPLFLFAGFNMLVSGYLTAVHLPLQSGIVAICRSLILPASLLLVFQYFFSDFRFLIALPIAEALTFLFCCWMYRAHQPHTLV